MIKAVHYKLETVTKTFCSITKRLHDCGSVYIYPPHEYRTKGGYKKPMPRLKKNKIKTVESLLASSPTIQQLEALQYHVIASEGTYFRDTSVRITDLIS